MAVEYKDLPFEEAIAFFRNKVNLPTTRWTDVWKQAHDSAFMVAGAAKADLLNDLRAAVDEAISQGTTLAQFRRDRRVDDAIAPLRAALETLLAGLLPLEERNAAMAAAVERGLELQARAQLLFDETSEVQVRWVEPLARGGVFNATPIGVADAFQQMLATYPGAWVLTSATLAADGRFEHFTGQLGLSADAGIALESPFDYPRQARLWLPQGLPDPSQPGHPQAVAEIALQLAAAGNGGLFVLCTSRRALTQIAAWLRPRLLQTLLVQGEADRAELVRQFAEDGNAVLVGTSSFWEGVDVPGQALRVVVIDKLPFAPPGDPVLDARLQALRAAGGREDAQPGLRQGELGAVGGDAHVAGQGEFAAPAEGVAVDGGDARCAQAGKCLPFGEMIVARHGLIGLVLHLLDVHAGVEPAALGPQDHDVDLGVAARGEDLLAEFEPSR